MPEVENCPLCKNPQVEMLNEHSTPVGAYCCGVRCDSLELWNRYAAAMELAYRYVESSGPHAEERQAHIAIKDHHDYLKLAQDRVLEVFK